MTLDEKVTNSLRVARRLYIKKDYDSAMKIYKSVLNRLNIHDVKYKIALCYMRKKDYPKSLGLLKQLQQIKKFEYRSVYHQSYILIKMQNFKSAIPVFEMLFKLNKNVSDRLYNRQGVCIFNMGDYDTALEYFHKAMKLKKKPLYFYNITCALMNLKKFDEALDYACKGIEVQNDYKDFYKLIGRIFYAKGKRKEALQFLTKTDLLKDDLETEELIGNIYYDKCQYLDAIRKYFYLYEQKHHWEKMIQHILKCFNRMGNEDMQAPCVQVLAGEITHARFSDIFKEELEKLKPTEEDYKKLMEDML